MDEAEKQIAQEHLSILGYNLPANRLLGCLLFFYILIVLTTFQDYGITIDEPPHAIYGRDIVFWYTSFFQDQDFLKAENMLFYGGFFDTLLYPITQLSPLPLHDSRHLCNAFVGLLGIVATYRLDTFLGSPTTGLLSALFLVLTPRFFGHTFNNPKDIPFATFYIWSIYYLVQGLKFLLTLSKKQIWQIGIAIGLALATRVGGVILFFYLGIFYGLVYLWMLQDRDRPAHIIRGFLIQGIGIFAIAYILMLLFWPRALLDPVTYPLHVLQVFSNFTYYVTTFFEGQEIKAVDIPWYYAPRWISMALPEFILVGLVLGACYLAINRTWFNRSRQTLQWTLIAFSAFFPPVYAVLTGSPLYDGIRHFLFILPSLAILSVAGFEIALHSLTQTWGRRGLASVMGILLILTLWDMIRLHPNQYVYFNRLFAGGLQKAAKQYQTDYWENTYKQGVRWIDGQVPQPQNRKLRIGAASNNVQYLLGDAYTFIEIPEPKEMDLYLSVTRADWHRLVPGEIIHTINVDEVPLLYIIKPDSTYQSDPFFMSARERQIRLSRRYDQVGNLNKSAQTYEILLKENDDPTIFSNLAESYIQLNRYEEAIEMCRQALALQPNHVKSILRLANALTYLNRFAEAEKMFQKTLQLQPVQKEGLHNYASLLLAQKKPSQAVSILNKALKTHPTHPPFWALLAKAYRRTKNLKSAWTGIARASELDPSNAKIQAEYINIGTTYLVQGQLKEAHNIYQAILKINPDLPILYFNLGIIYNRQERLEDAARMYQRAAELSPSDSQAYLELAKVSQKLGRQEEADQVYQKKSIDQAADTTIALLNKTGINPGRLSIGQTWPDGSVKKKSKPYSNRS